MDSVILIVNDPGDGTRWSHGPEWSLPWWNPQLRMWLMRASIEASLHYCTRGGCRIAPPELQSADQ
jgi:hypothetical protein